MEHRAFDMEGDADDVHRAGRWPAVNSSVSATTGGLARIPMDVWNLLNDNDDTPLRK